MKARASLLSCILSCIVLLCYRGYYSEIGGGRERLFITQWDAFGYYLYLPATFIHHDLRKLGWAQAADSQYQVGGGGALPVVQLENGHRVSKYLGGVALLQMPLFAAGHLAAAILGYPKDGLSPPYQYALAFGAILYCFLALLLLRRILLGYFQDRVVAVTLLLLSLATNLPQYAAVDNGLSHGWIFPLYVLQLYATILWHQRPGAGRALAIGYLTGLATICRPTEAVMLFIPLLWNTHSRKAASAKWQAVRSHPAHVALAVLGGLLGVMPQLLYWKLVTGSFVYDVGSKWVFFNPWWRVLTGWEKGWFIYTPVTVLIVAGLLLLRRYPFKNAVLVFCLLNIWVVISWDEWQYGASYSCRALMQSYPVFALPLAAVTERLSALRWRRYLFYAAGSYLIGVNLFQTVQYNSTILHYNDMNRRYYGRIYLNPSPSALDMSLLDVPDWLRSETGYDRYTLLRSDSTRLLGKREGGGIPVADVAIPGVAPSSGNYLRADLHLNAAGHIWKSRLQLSLQHADSTRTVSLRLFNPVGARTGQYASYIALPELPGAASLHIALDAEPGFEGRLDQLSVVLLRRHPKE